MYLPFLRGKQYELLALREFAKEIASSEIVSPIIEPVKSDTKSIETAVNELIKKNVNFTLIANPTVGEIETPGTILSFIKECKLNAYENFQIGFHTFSEKQITSDFEMLKYYGLDSKKITLIHNDAISNEVYVKDVLNGPNIRFNIFNEKIKAKRYKRLFDRKTSIILEDAFILKERNSDYAAQTDEFFSDEYLAYKEEGYAGFSDFLTIGEPYSEAGFLPYAVAIHITYASSDSIRIRHFVSDTNDDYSDTPGKFKEALDKLVLDIPVLTAKGIKTKALDEFQAHHTAGHYPGLGSIKKLSVLNHLELVNTLLASL